MEFDPSAYTGDVHYVRALINERDGYLRVGKSAAAAEVEKELRRLAKQAAPPEKRAERRPAMKASASTRSDG